MTELWPVAAKIALSALLAGAVGAERAWTGKWAGLRTHMLIAVGSALLTDLSIHIGPRFSGGSAAWDPGRIAAQIVSGVGFICAGTILQSRGAVHGLTTAAGLWVSSAIGMAVGAAFYGEAAIGTLALLLILAALRPIERLLFANRKTIAVVLRQEETLAALRDLLHAADVRLEEIRITPGVEGSGLLARYHGPPEAREKLRRLAVERGLAILDEVD